MSFGTLYKEVYYDDKTYNHGNCTFSVGYAPQEGVYVSTSYTRHPRFCFEGISKEEVIAKAQRALDFYEKNGLKESLDNISGL